MSDVNIVAIPVNLLGEKSVKKGDHEAMKWHAITKVKWFLIGET